MTDIIKKRTRKARGTGSQNNSAANSATNSRTTSPIGSPNRFQVLTNRETEDDDEAWKCKICSAIFTQPDDKVLECQRCNQHFCIKCLDKTEEEYTQLNNSDSMWFCIPCKEKVVKNILVDRKIEVAFKEMTKKFDERISQIEKNMEDKCSKEETISIVREEIDKRMPSRDNIPAAAEGTDKPEGGTDVNVVLAEMNERKQREPYIIIYGQEECNSADRETRAKVHILTYLGHTPI